MKKVYDYLINDISLCKNDIVLVGVSAGPDSMALLHILCEIREKLYFKLIVAHVNHNLRTESVKEAHFLEDYCKEHDVLFEYMLISKYGDDNFHNEARNIRYSFYRELIDKYGANYLMTGHHGDDLMETILMRIVRGSSIKGYSGFNDYIDMGTYKIVRPLVFVTKKELEDFNEKNNVPYCIDKSNFKDKYTRNRYRKDVLPFLKREDPLVHEKFLKFSKTLLEYDKYLEKEMFKNLHKVYNNGMVHIKEFLELDLLIQKRIVDYLFARVYMDDLMLISDCHFKLFFDIIKSRKPNIKYNLPNNYKLVKAYDKIYFKKNIDDISSYDMELSDNVSLPNGMTLKRVFECDENGNDILRINSKDVSLPLRVRTRHIGDRISVLNGGTKKVKDIFIDKKIPSEKRDMWPVVVDAKDIVVWIPNLKKSKYNRLKNDSYDIIIKCC